MMRPSTIESLRLARWMLPLLGLASCGTPGAKSQRPPGVPSVDTAAKSELPVRRVRIYESGLAEFERSGQLRGSLTALQIPSSDIDDVLRTLVIRRGSALVPVYSASFDTVTMAQVARARAHLPTEPKLGSEYSEFVRSLVGENIEISANGQRVRGRLVEFVRLEPREDKSDNDDTQLVEKKPTKSKTKAAAPQAKEASEKYDWQEFELTVLTDHGVIERYRTDKVEWLRPVDPAVTARLDTAAAAKSGRAADLVRTLQIAAESAEPVNLTYVTDAPLPRITYRLHAGKNGKLDTLQGLALVHNTSDEPWESVVIEISNEDIDSAIVPFVAPRYWDRAVHTTREGGASIVPQLKHSSSDALSESGTEPRMTRDASNSTPWIASRARKSTDGVTPRMPSNSSRNTAVGRSAYTYTVAGKPTIAARSSGLFPFLETEIKVERGVWFGHNALKGRSVVRIQNTTSQSLPAGLLSVFDAERFLGETELSQLEPGRYGYFDFANELKLELSKKPAKDPQLDYRAVSWSNDALQTRIFEHTEQAVELTNASAQNLTAFLAINALDGAIVKGVDGVDTNILGRPVVAIVKVPAQGHVDRTIVVEQEREDSSDVDSLNVDTLTQIAAQQTLPAASRAVLLEAIKLLKGKQAMTERKETLDTQVGQLEETIGRLPVSDSPASNAIATRFLQLEAQRSELQRQSAGLERTIEQQAPLLKKALSRLPQK